MKWILGIVTALLLSACNLSAAAPTPDPTVTMAPVVTPAPVDEGMGSGLPVVGYEDLEPSGAGSCLIAPTMGAIPVYLAPDTSSVPLALLGTGRSLVTFQYESAGFYAVNFPMASDMLVGWLPEAGTSVRGDCQYLYQPTVCSVRVAVGRVIDVHAGPSRDSTIIGALGDRYSMPFVGFTDDGWFIVQVDAGQIGYVAPDEGRLDGPCDNGS